jgi:diguanylate cyclase (GGDEF)-like protein
VLFLVLTFALGVAILAVVVSAYAARRSRKAANQRIADAVQQFSVGMHDTIRDLVAAVETAPEARPLSLHRRSFREALAREVERAHRYDRPLALMVFDLDGHPAGDLVLAEVADRLRAACRSADVPSRVGGDQFAVILPESNYEEAELLARRVARTITVHHEPATVSLAAGVAELQPGDRASDLFERADDARRRRRLGTLEPGSLREPGTA